VPLDDLANRLDGATALDPAVDAYAAVADRVVPKGPVRDVLQGSWLGHPLHPLLTDLAIGFWTSASVLDLTGRRGRWAADAMLVLGTVSALPTVAAGIADWTAMPRDKQRTGVVHAASNAVATALYTASIVARARGRRGRGVALQLAGTSAATLGGFLGGHLAFATSSDT
jgi:uncharacterized membrane protein